MKKVKTRRNCLRRAGFEKWLGLLRGFEKKKKMWFVMGPPTRDRQACSPLIQLFFGFASEWDRYLISDIDQTNINRDIRDGKWLSNSG